MLLVVGTVGEPHQHARNTMQHHPYITLNHQIFDVYRAESICRHLWRQHRCGSPFDLESAWCRVSKLKDSTRQLACFDAEARSFCANPWCVFDAIVAVLTVAGSLGPFGKHLSEKRPKKPPIPQFVLSNL